MARENVISVSACLRLTVLMKIPLRRSYATMNLFIYVVWNAVVFVLRMKCSYKSFLFFLFLVEKILNRKRYRDSLTKFSLLRYLNGKSGKTVVGGRERGVFIPPENSFVVLFIFYCLERFSLNDVVLVILGVNLDDLFHFWRTILFQLPTHIDALPNLWTL